MKIVKERLYLVFLIICQLGCLSSDGSETSHLILIPEVYFECRSDQSSDCSNTAANLNRSVYIGLISSTSIDCRSYLESIPTGQFSHYFDASGFTVTSFNGLMMGSVNTWVSTTSQPIAYIEIANHTACAYIDTNENEQLDPSESVGELQFHATEDQPIVKDWF